MLKLVYGDKDLFRLVWMKLKALFHVMDTLPALAGRYINGSLCGTESVVPASEALGAPQEDGYPDPVL
ncbi:Tryptophan--tRNA ligase [Phytophthora cinnamomi]|uniref:Tryptophan--tRNA ligase n=1 Tax=Phytophthora cinnamomi TaxID=4785 RepID=UPI00355980E7|nr:Tryptophan--tRNA ligase [Phytophthora cinnamomi]